MTNTTNSQDLSKRIEHRASVAEHISATRVAAKAAVDRNPLANGVVKAA